MSYPDAVIAHNRTPRNAGSLDRSAPGVGMGAAGSIEEGVSFRLYIRLSPDETIEEARFRAYGCPWSIACASAGTEWMRGRAAAEAESGLCAALQELLDLPDERRRHAEMLREALREAIQSAREGRA